MDFGSNFHVKIALLQTKLQKSAQNEKQIITVEMTAMKANMMCNFGYFFCLFLRRVKNSRPNGDGVNVQV